MHSVCSLVVCLREFHRHVGRHNLNLKVCMLNSIGKGHFEGKMSHAKE